MFVYKLSGCGFEFRSNHIIASIQNNVVSTLISHICNTYKQNVYKSPAYEDFSHYKLQLLSPQNSTQVGCSNAEIFFCDQNLFFWTFFYRNYFLSKKPEGRNIAFADLTLIWSRFRQIIFHWTPPTRRDSAEMRLSLS